jgi:hypothetical protein
MKSLRNVLGACLSAALLAAGAPAMVCLLRQCRSSRRSLLRNPGVRVQRHSVRNRLEGVKRELVPASSLSTALKALRRTLEAKRMDW